MIIGIFSDTHDSKDNIEKAKQVFLSQKVEETIFCGDLVSPFTLSFLAKWPFTIHVVFGNNEGDKWGINRRFSKFNIKNIDYAPKSGLFFELEFDGKKIAVFHGHITEFTNLLIESGKYDLVATGHTHEPNIQVKGNTTWVNPGSVVGFSENPEIKEGSVAIYDTLTNVVTLLNLQGANLQ